MNRNVLFLDIDGVLNSAMYWWRHHPLPLGQAGAIDPDAVAHLNTIVERVNPTIILSSSWRGRRPDGYARVQDILVERGFAGQLSGQTTWFNDSERHAEIADWLGRNNGWTRFAVLDDDQDAWASVVPFTSSGLHVPTNYMEGMDTRHVAMICEWFRVSTRRDFGCALWEPREVPA